MTKSLTLLCLACVFSLAATAQKKVSSKFQEKIKILVTDIPRQQPALQMISFAKTLIGIPYRYASSNPNKGFDCSGFVNYVFQNVGFSVPRSSREFSSAGTQVNLKDAKVGDVLIFTGSNPKVRSIGHVGIVYAIEGDEIKFIHSSSGKAKGVTISDMDSYYKSRFLKAVSII